MLSYLESIMSIKIYLYIHKEIINNDQFCIHATNMSITCVSTYFILVCRVFQNGTLMFMMRRNSEGIYTCTGGGQVYSTNVILAS